MEGVDTSTAKFVIPHSDATVVTWKYAISFTVVHYASGEHSTTKLVVVLGRSDEWEIASEISTLTWCVGADTTSMHHVF